MSCSFLKPQHVCQYLTYSKCSTNVHRMSAYWMDDFVFPHQVWIPWVYWPCLINFFFFHRVSRPELWMQYVINGYLLNCLKRCGEGCGLGKAYLDVNCLACSQSVSLENLVDRGLGALWVSYWASWGWMSNCSCWIPPCLSQTDPLVDCACDYLYLILALLVVSIFSLFFEFIIQGLT